MMHGLRVIPAFRYPREELTAAERLVRPSPRLIKGEGSEFSLYFASVLPALERLVWFADEDAFRFPPDWYCEEDESGDAPLVLVQQRRKWIALQGDGSTTLTVDPNWILDPGFLSIYAQYVNDDWNWLYGFATPPHDWRQWMRERDQAAFLESTVEVCFFSVDGAYWEFFAQKPELVKLVRENLGNMPGLRMEQADLATSIL